MSLQKGFLIMGATLFLLGLASGLAIGMMANPRMGLSAHIQGLTNGMFLIAVGAAWRFVGLGRRAAVVTFCLLAYGTVANWASTTLAAVWNTGQLTPIHAPEPNALAWQEGIVSAGLLSLTVAMISGTLLLLVGFLQGTASDQTVRNS